MTTHEAKKYPFSFIKWRAYSYIFSIALMVVFAIPLVTGSPVNWGIDFAGGIKMQAKLPQNLGFDNLKAAVNKIGVSATIQSVGTKDKNEYLISMGILQEQMQESLIQRYAPAEEKKELLDKLKSKQPLDVVSLLKWSMEANLFPDGKIPKIQEERIDWQNSESVGPAVGSMLRKDSIKLFLITSLFMLLYLAFRFEFKFSVAAMVALVHDLIVVTLYIALTGVEISVPVLAALLTLLGYSINDTIVIFDRIRENNTLQTKAPLIENIDNSIWQSMSRSLLTSLTTLVAVIAILILGGENLRGFSITLVFGLVIGTYSSVFVAAPILYDWDKLFSGRKSRRKPMESKYSV